MATLTYGTTAIPSDDYSVTSGGTVDNISAAFATTVGLVGGMDKPNGTATPGDVVLVSSPSDAQSKFGDGSELHEQVKAAYNNGAGEVYALPVTETQTTESFSSTDNGTLANNPFDPNVQDEHTIDETNTSASIVITYEDPATTTPGTDEINLNPVTGDWKADTSDSYDIQYSYGTYDSATMQKLADQGTRMVGVCSEVSSYISNMESEVQDNADSFTFQHVVAGADPVPDPSSAGSYVSGYSDSFDSERLTLVSPSRAYMDESETNQQRTVGGIAGYLASLPLGLSSTNDAISTYQGLRADYTFSQAGDLADKQVMPLLDYPPITVVKDMTTSTDPKFERVYAMQVVDELTELSHEISQVYVGEQNTPTSRNQLRRSLRNMLIGLRTENPPLIDGFAVSVQQNASNSNQTDVEIGASVVDIMDRISVNITLGDILQQVTVS